MQMLAFCCVHIALVVPECQANIFYPWVVFHTEVHPPAGASQYEHRALRPGLCGILQY